MNPIAPEWQIGLTLFTGGIVAVFGAYLSAIAPRAGVRRRVAVLTAGALGGWYLLSLVLALRGFFAAPLAWSPGDIRGFLIFGSLMSAPIVAFVLAQQRSFQFRRLLTAAGLPFLVGLQVYRSAGIVFLALLSANLLPRSFAVTTAVADLIVGLSAPLLAWGVARGFAWARPATIAWSLFGLADFAVALPTVALSLFGVISLNPAPSLIGFHPLALISLVNVPLAICLHVLVLQRLLLQPAGNLLNRPQPQTHSG